MWSLGAGFLHLACGLLGTCLSDSYNYSGGVVCTTICSITMINGASAILGLAQVLGHTAAMVVY